ncbi:MAG TPA: sulfotransferase domain-containing protein [Myxococcota bacterium]|nr:sulfotransferase domain-containing protein [Myxococcota bacterium]
MRGGERRPIVPLVLPQFLVIGAQKSGTTSLYRYLGRHPEMVRARHKELHYFDREFARGPRWYETQLAPPWRVLARRLVGRRTLCGEATPAYLTDPAVPARVRALLPDVRLVALLRDPSRRAVSHYHHRVRNEGESGGAAAVLDAELARVEREGDAHLSPFGYLARGYYARQLERWLAHFPRESFLLLPAEPFFRDPAPTVRRVADFVGLAPLDPATYVGAFNVRHAGRYESPPAELLARLDAHYAPHNEQLAKLWPELGAAWARA